MKKSMNNKGDQCPLNKKALIVLKTYENGAYFQYKELQRRLLDLFETLPLNRLGNSGIYFQEEDYSHITKLQLLKKTNQLNNNKLLKIAKPNIYFPKKTIQFIPPSNKIMGLSTRNGIFSHCKPYSQYTNTMMISSQSKSKDKTIKLTNHQSKKKSCKLTLKIKTKNTLPEIGFVLNTHSNKNSNKHRKIIKHFKAKSDISFLY